MICGQDLRSQPGLDHVPLSCVPPCTLQGFPGLIATLTNCSVASLRSMCVILFGIRESRRWQARVPFAGCGGRVVVHVSDVSTKLPSVRITPPSEPSKICVGLLGLTRIMC